LTIQFPADWIIFCTALAIVWIKEVEEERVEAVDEAMVEVDVWFD